MAEYVYRVKVSDDADEGAMWQWRNLFRRLRYLTREGAKVRLRLLAEKGIAGTIERSHPVEWPADTGMPYGSLSDHVRWLAGRLAEAEVRLEIAERVCVLYGWTIPSERTDCDKALAEMWQEWARVAGPKFTGPKAHPLLTDEWIAAVAREHDERRAAKRQKAAALLAQAGVRDG